MADQQRKVSLVFEANTNQAKANINDLVATLQKIQSMPSSLIDPTGIKEASRAALDLQNHIQKAVNVDTGKLDLSRFTASLTASGKQLSDYRDTLTRIGPEGSAAFRSLLGSINNAEVSTVRLTKGMRDFLVTMKNTAKWQISSSIMHGLIGSLQTAYGYAKSLDSSLNNIRIVTGQTSDQMARFAVEANRAAQSLSTTTTKYTDAALIFYQQGLSDQAVKERTEAVIKMANVTGEVAADVSSYMTAIWNNFDDGSKSLEYYADVITKLGAATAASSEEIAGGLEKFAAIANTIGLSYEYATSMITTIVDRTRQSEDVVGTALKTILARIQGLNLGDTLDDGTTLNKYSEALAKVGIDIKDASGQLRDMDLILDDLGAKWGTFSKDTQVALAQVVGGVRQYNQIISLMDNWSAFQQNVDIAQTASGSLDEQADIYAESWEAARNRVTAAAQGIYDAIINEDAFIKLDNIFTGLLNGVSGVIKGMGGMVPILGTIGGIITQKFAKEMPVALNNMKQNLMVLSGQASKGALQTQKTNTLMAQDMISRADNSYEASQYETIRRISSMKEKLIENQHRMNSAQVEEYQALIQNEQAIRNIIDERAKSLALLEQEVQTMKEMLGIETAMSVDESQMEEVVGQEADEAIAKDKESERYKTLLAKKKGLEGLMSAPEEDGTSEAYAQNEAELNKINDQLEVLESKAIRVFEKYSEYIKRTASEMVDLSAKQGIATRNANNFNKFLKPENIKSYEGNMQGLKAVLENWNSIAFQSKDSSKYLQEALDALGKEGAEEKDIIEAVTQAVKKMAEAERQAAADLKFGTDAKVQELIKGGANKKDVYRLRNQGGLLGPQSEENLENNEPEGPEIKLRGNIEVLTQAAGTLMSAYGAFNAIISASNTLMDENATAMEKAGAVMGALTSVTFAATGVLGLYNTLNESQIVHNIKKTGTTLASAGAVTTEGVAYGFLTTMVKKAQVAVGGFMASNPIGWIMGIVAAITVLGIALYKVVTAETAQEKKLKELRKETELLNKAQENLKTQINEVESAWSNYQDMVEALEACTKGTKEWNEALLKTNEAVLTLISTAPELSKYVQYNADGTMSLGGLEYENFIKQKNSQQSYLNAQRAINEAEIGTLSLSLNKDFRESYFNSPGSVALNANKDNLLALSEEANTSKLSEVIVDIFKAYKEDNESAIDFLISSGLIKDSQKAIELYKAYEEGKREFTSAELFNERIGLYGGRTVQTYSDYDKSVFENLLKVQDEAQKTQQYNAQRKAGLTAKFNQAEGFDINLIEVYEKELNKKIDQIDFSNIDALEGENLYNTVAEAFGGVASDYEDDDVEYLRNLLKTTEYLKTDENFTNIVKNANEYLNTLNEVGKDLYLAQGNSNKLNLNKRNKEELDFSNLKEIGLLPEYINPANQTQFIDGVAINWDNKTLEEQQNWLYSYYKENKEAINEEYEKLREIASTDKDFVNSIWALYAEDDTLDTDPQTAMAQDFIGIVAEAKNSHINNLNKVDKEITKVQLALQDYIGFTYREAWAFLQSQEVKNYFAEDSTRNYADLLNEVVNGGADSTLALSAFEFANADRIKELDISLTEAYSRNSLSELLGLDLGIMSQTELETIKERFALEGETAEEIVAFIEESYEKAKINTAIDWAQLDTGFNLQYDEVSKTLTSSSLAGQKAIDEGASREELGALGQFYEQLNNILPIKEVKAFDSLLSDMIASEEINITEALNIVQEAQSRMMSLGRDLTKEDLQSVLTDMGISATTLGVDMDELAEAINSTANVVSFATGAFSNLTTALGAIKEHLTDLESGSTIDADDWAEVETYVPEEYKDKFWKNAEGGMTFTGTDEEAKIIADISYATQGQTYLENVNRLNDIVDNFISTHTGLPAIAGSGIGIEGWLNAQSIKENNESFTNLLRDLGMSQNYNNLTRDEQGNIDWSTDSAQAFKNEFASIMSGETTNPEIVSQVLASIGAGFDQMQQWVQEGLINEENADYALSEGIKTDYSRDFGISTDDIEERVEYLKKYGDTAEASAEEVTKLAATQLRFERGVDKGRDSIEDWVKVLQKGDKKVENYIDTVEGINDVYADLFDIDYDSLSAGFIESAENAELLEKALKGDIKAYRELQRLAADDLFEGEDLESILPEQKELNIGVDETAWDNTLTKIQEDINSIDDINITADMSLESINQKLSQLKFNSESAALEASESLSAMGVDATVEKVPYRVPGKRIVTSYRGNVPVGGEGYTEVNSEVIETRLPYTDYYYVLKGKNFNGNIDTPSTPASSGGGGGGGGGGGRRDPGKKKGEKDKDRYHVITNQIEDLTDALEKVDKATDRAFGRAKVKLLEEQEKALSKLIVAQQDYIKEIEDYLSKDKDNLYKNEFLSGLGIDLQFDENGTIVNYEELEQKMIDDYNKMRKKYKKGKISDDEWEEYQKKWDKAKELLDQYEETQDLLKNANQELLDLINQVHDNRLLRITILIEADLSTVEYALDIIDYKLNKIADDAWEAAESLALLGEQMNEYARQGNAYETGIREIFEKYTEDITVTDPETGEERKVADALLTQAEVDRIMAGNLDPNNESDKALLDKIGQFTEEDIETLREYHNGLIETNRLMLEARENVYATLVSSFQQFNEELDAGLEKMRHLTSMLNHYRNIADIVGNENLGISDEMMNSLGQTAVDMQINELGTQKNNLDALKTAEGDLRDQIDALKATGVAEDTAEAERLEKEVLGQIQEDIRTAEEDFMGSWEDTLNSINEQFANAVATTIKRFSDTLAGPLAGSLEELQENFQRATTLEEAYLPDYEKIYELNKLNRDITNSIDETDNIRSKQLLAELQSEINALQEDGVKLSQYETENLRRKYELRLAESALTEAQNAKSQVQMQRDASGNWSYVYTANEEDVAEAEQNYEDKLFAMQQANGEYINELQDSIITLQSEMTSSIETIMNDETLSMEERMIKVDETSKYYSDLMDIYSSQLQIALGENGILYEQDWQRYSELTGYKISKEQDFIDKFGETKLAQLTGFRDLQDLTSNFKDATVPLYGELTDAIDQWRESTENAFNKAGTSMTNYSDTLTKEKEKIETEHALIEKNTKDLAKKVTDEYQKIIDKYNEWYISYGSKITEMVNENQKLIDSYKDILQYLTDINNSGLNRGPNTSPGTNPDDDPENDDPDGDDPNGDEDERIDKAEANKQNIALAILFYKKHGWGKKGAKKIERFEERGMDGETVLDHYRTLKNSKTFESKKEKRKFAAHQLGIKTDKSNPDWRVDTKNKLKEYKYKNFAFATGGYTGSWGSEDEGRFALLHEKELVLNKTDTENFLSAIDILRQVSEAIDLNAVASSGFGATLTAGALKGNAGTLEQNVHITAEFPNATNRTEIYEAFNDIINLASQYSNRK